MAAILVKNKYEEDLLAELMQEFASKVLTSRSKGIEQFKEIFGVTEVILDNSTNEKYYITALPEHYQKFIAYLINKSRQ